MHTRVSRDSRPRLTERLGYLRKLQTARTNTVLCRGDLDKGYLRIVLLVLLVLVAAESVKPGMTMARGALSGPTGPSGTPAHRGRCKMTAPRPGLRAPGHLGLHVSESDSLSCFQLSTSVSDSYVKPDSSSQL
eukprot:530630-Rhodomonas_salina.2